MSTNGKLRKRKLEQNDDSDESVPPPPPPPPTKSRGGFLKLHEIILIALLAASCSLGIYKGLTHWKWLNAQPRLMTVEELALHDGGDDRYPTYLAIMGEVFDVSSGEYYKKDAGGYNFFAGKDGTRSFLSGVFEGDADDSVDGLNEVEILNIKSWVNFYRDHETYTYVGKLIGRYYDAEGNPTAARLEADKLIVKGEQLKEKSKEMKQLYPVCNSRWTQTEGGEVWCESSLLKIRKPDSPLVPRNFTSTLSHEKPRCACVEVGKDLGDEFVVYKDCEPTSQRCKTTPPKVPATPAKVAPDSGAATVKSDPVKPSEPGKASSPEVPQPVDEKAPPA